MKRRYAILAPGHFSTDAKTAHGIIRYAQDETVAVIDPACAGRRVSDVLPQLNSDAPIVASVRAALAFKPTALLIGTAPIGGALPAAWRTEVFAALEASLEIVSGLHDFLSDDAAFAAAAQAHNARIWDVRKTQNSSIFRGDVYDVRSPIVLTVGNDCAVGKMTVSLELARAAEAAGVRAAFVPTGQTGIMIAGWGTSIDRVVADFASGATEQLVLHAAKSNPGLILIEGQGALNHPAYAPVTLALLYGSGADALLLVVDPQLRELRSYATPALGYRALIALHEAVAAPVKPAPVIGIALRTHHLSQAQAAIEIARAQRESGLPCDDVVRNGPDRLYAAVSSQLKKTLATKAAQ